MNILFGGNGRIAKRSERNVVRPTSFTAGGLLLATVIVGSLAGCGATRPMQYYQLTVPADVHHAETNASGISLALGPLVASHLYREDRIVFSSGPQQMGTYEFQRWTEPPAEMIQEVLLRELRASSRYREVFAQRSASRSDYVLRGRLYDFKEVNGSPLQARVTIEFELRDMKSGATVWSHYYNHNEPVSGKDVPAMVAALD
ncbi:MAG: cholesterol transport system auxiliary component, partial [Acidobacteriaceae bacterium]|nr:cholesterol transport system auxiliary component [Acidobacteriaceae bacterium]